MRWLRFVFIMSLLCSVSIVSARQILQADQCTIRPDETVQGNLFVACRTLLVEGTVTGDLVGATTTAQINGVVEGSVYLLAGRLDVFGTIERDLHFGGPILRIHEGAQLNDGDVYSISLSTVSQEAVPGSVVNAGYQLILEGDVGREVSFWGSALTIDGDVGGDVDATVGDPNSSGVAELRALLTPVEIDLRNPGLYVTGDGMIRGQLTYTGPAEGEILAELPQEPIFQQSVQNDLSTLTESENLLRSLGAYFAQVLREIITLGLIGLLMLLLLPSAIQAPIPTLRLRPLPSVGVGLLAFILSFPVFFMLIFLSIILVLVLSLLQLQEITLISTLLAGVFDFSAIGLFYFIAFMVSRVIVALALGRFIIRRLFGDDTAFKGLLASLFIGVVILAVFASLPFVGWLISALALFLGLGAILTLLQEQLEKARAASRPVAVTDTIEAHPVPPPVIEDEPREPGTENLPSGFKWWD